MANIQSQIKRNRQNEVRRVRNKALRSELKTMTRRTLAVAETGDTDAALEELRRTQRKIDKAAEKGVIHRNTAARRKSRLAALVNSRLG